MLIILLININRLLHGTNTPRFALVNVRAVISTANEHESSQGYYSHSTIYKLQEKRHIFKNPWI